MSFSSNFIKTKDKKFHYYPYGTVMKECSMPIKDGHEEFLKKSLDDEMKIALAAPIMGMGLLTINPWLVLICLFIVPYLIYKRKSAVKSNCEYIYYPFSIFLKNYNKINIYFANPSWFSHAVIGQIVAILISIGTYGKPEYTLIFYIVIGYGILNVYAIYIYYHAWIRYRETNPFNKNAFIKKMKLKTIYILKYYIVLPIIIVALLISVLSYI